MLAQKLQQSIPRSVRMLRKLVITVLDGTLTLHQTRILFLIKEGLGQSQIAETLGVSAAAVCKTMHNLSEKGLVEMSPGKDKRERLIELTKDGSKILAAVSKQVQKKLDKSIATLTKQERDDLMKGLEILEKLNGQIKEG